LLLTSLSNWTFMHNLFTWKWVRLQLRRHGIQSPVHIKGYFARGLVLKQRLKVTRKWPISLVVDYSNPTTRIYYLQTASATYFLNFLTQIMCSEQTAVSCEGRSRETASLGEARFGNNRIVNRIMARGRLSSPTFWWYWNHVKTSWLKHLPTCYCHDGIFPSIGKLKMLCKHTPR